MVIGGAESATLAVLAAAPEEVEIHLLVLYGSMDDAWAMRFAVHVNSLTVPSETGRRLPLRRLLPRIVTPETTAVCISDAPIAFRYVRSLRKRYPDLRIIDNHHVAAPAVSTPWAPRCLPARKAIDLHTVVSEDQRAWLQSYGVADDRVQMISNGVVVPDRKVGNVIPRRTTHVGFLGRLVREKGPDVFVKAALKSSESVQWLVAGDGPMRSELEDLVAASGPGARISFLGFVDGSAFVESIDILVLPSKAEGLPVAVLEAMAVGVPVIASPVGAVPEVVRDGETGVLLVDDVDDDRLAAEISAKVSDLVSDPELLRALGHNARRLVSDKHSVSAMTEAYWTALRRNR